MLRGGPGFMPHSSHFLRPREDLMRPGSGFRLVGSALPRLGSGLRESGQAPPQAIAGAPPHVCPHVLVVAGAALAPGVASAVGNPGILRGPGMTAGERRFGPALPTPHDGWYENRGTRFRRAWVNPFWLRRPRNCSARREPFFSTLLGRGFSFDPQIPQVVVEHARGNGSSRERFQDESNGELTPEEAVNQSS